MKFVADLHIHSKYSRATAKNLDLENLWIAAQLKGITVVGTGDFTHPAWFSEIKEKLEPAEPGLFRLKEHIADAYKEHVPSACRGMVRFILVSEISNIYKKNEKTRKNHNLIFAPNLEVAENINARLDAIGNIHSDGRPILGLDARNLLEIVLEESDDNFLIPAHIWTPWFSVLGSKSGFDSIEECFEDLSDYVFALETGLSSDPPMNWRVSSLDRFTLISNSDAHSPMKLGREANLFDTDLSYFAIRSALETHDAQKFLGTFEFYPEEGKYHVDGHRKCRVRLLPSESLSLDNMCPVCGKPLTLGVLYRVEQLADRSEQQKPEHAGAYHNLIPLEHILSELLKVGPASKKVQTQYRRLLHRLGSEFDILHRLPIDSLKGEDVPLLGEALNRVRENRVHFSPGYDGEFGKVEIFSVEEREELLNQRSLFQFIFTESSEKKRKKKKISRAIKPKVIEVEKDNEGSRPAGISVNQEQKEAIAHSDGPLLIVAGPGTGKTFTLTRRIFHLIDNQKIEPEHILAVTFTRKAALEMRTRLQALLPKNGTTPLVTTFHGLCWGLIQEDYPRQQPSGIIDPDDCSQVLRDAVELVCRNGINLSVSEKAVSEGIVAAKQSIIAPDELSEDFNQTVCPIVELVSVYSAYQQILKLHNLIDYEDVIFKIVRRLEEDHQYRKRCQERFPYIFVDEYQDLNQGQYRIMKALASDGKSNICVIGDPDQAIYGFRGSDLTYFKRFKMDYPQARIIHLSRNYRSTETILKSSFQVIQKGHISISDEPGNRTYSGISGIRTISIMSGKSVKAEAVAIGRVIEQMVGGMGFHAVDFDKLNQYQDDAPRSFSDFAVLFRTHDQGRMIKDILEKAGIPCQLASRDNLLNADGINEILRLLKMDAGIGSYIDFECLSHSFKPGPSSAVISAFKQWAYTKQMRLIDACAQVRRIPIPHVNGKGQQKLLTLIDQIESLCERIAHCPLNEKIEILSQTSLIRNLVGDNRNFQEILKKIVDRSSSFGLETAEFLASLSLESDTDSYDAKVEKVVLMTMHAAKGLEFPIVFIAGCEDGLIPYRHNGFGESNHEEERRLFYVAMTRAKEMLFLSWASERSLFGQLKDRDISPFVQDIEKHLQKFVTTESKPRNTLKQTQLNLFEERQ